MDKNFRSVTREKHSKEAFQILSRNVQLFLRLSRMKYILNYSQWSIFQARNRISSGEKVDKLFGNLEDYLEL